MEWFRKIFGRKKENYYEQNYLAQQPLELSSKVNTLKNKSGGWTTADLKEIVEVLYILNNKFLELSADIDRLRTRDMISGSQDVLNKSMGGNYRKPSYSKKTHTSRIPASSVKSSGTPTNRTQNLPYRDYSLKENISKNDVKDEFNNKRKLLEKYIEIFREAKSLIGKEIPGLNSNESELAKTYDHTNEKAFGINEDDSQRDTKLRRLIADITRLPVSTFFLSLCAAIESEMSSPSNRLDSSRQKILEVKIFEIAELFNWEIICPDNGSFYNEKEHDIFKTVREPGSRDGCIRNVQCRGYKSIGNGKVIQKAKVSVTG